MAKKSSGKQQISLSPKKYFQTRLRQVPVYECFVTTGWEESRQPVVLISRKHVNGNYSFAMFVVDLYCLGIIYTNYWFNFPSEDYDEMKEMIFQTDNGVEYEQIDYTLAHNIVYAGLEYAYEFDIEPHKDFAITKFMLEEDDNNVELIDIECGKDGKPFFILENYTDINKLGNPQTIIDKLENAVGSDGYNYVSMGDEMDETDEIPPDFPIDKDSELYKELKTDIEKFYDLYDALYDGNLKEEEADELIYLTQKFAEILTDKDEVDRFYDAFFDLDVPGLLSDSVSGDLLDELNLNKKEKEKADDLIHEIISNFDVGQKELFKKLNKLRKIIPECPLTGFFEAGISLGGEYNPDDVDQIVENLHNSNLQDSLMKILEQTKLIHDKNYDYLPGDDKLRLSYFFARNKTISVLEFQAWLDIFIVSVTSFSDRMEQKLALLRFLHDDIIKNNKDNRFVHFRIIAIIKSMMEDVDDKLSKYPSNL